MGRIVTQLKLANFADPNKALSVSALVDTRAAVDMLGHRLVHVKHEDLK